MARNSIVIILILAVALFAAIRYGASQRHERIRLGANQQTLLERNRQYHVRDSLNATSVRSLTLRLKEFEAGFTELGRLVRDMGLKLKRVENISRNAIRSDYEISAPVRDTVIVRADTSAVVKAHVISYRTPHIEMTGRITGPDFQGTIITYDTLTQVVHRVPKRFLFIRYGTKELRQEIVSSNPHTRIVYSRTIKIEK